MLKPPPTLPDVPELDFTSLGLDSPPDDLTVLPPVEERANTSSSESSESKEAISLAKMEAFSDQLAIYTVGKFWNELHNHPERNGNGVTQEELLEKVSLRLRDHIAKNLEAINGLVFGSQNPRQAFEGASSWLQHAAMDFSQLIYEHLKEKKKNGIDELTGLPNRSIFNRNLNTAIERNHRFGEGFSLIFFDLDHFKDVNDTYGHGAGDTVLQEVSHRLRLRELDSLVRFGGEEFIIILPATPKEGGCILAQRIAEQIGTEPYSVVGKDGEPLQIKVTASIGIAEYTDCNKDPHGEDVKRRADLCLYILKGKDPDADGVIEDRRGLIACDGRVVSLDDLKAYRLKMGSARSSFPAAKKE